MQEAVICAPLRTGIAKEAGGLKALQPEEIGGQVIQALVDRSGIDPSLVDDVIVGNWSSTQQLGRHCALLGGLPLEVPGFAVNRACASGLQAVVSAAQAVLSSSADLLIAGGVESQTLAPFLLERPTEAYQRWPPKFAGAGSRGDFDLPELGLNTPMGVTAENVAEKYGITREEQDAFALESQRRTARALEEGAFRDQIVPIRVPGRRGEQGIFESDECPRPDSTLETLAKLPPIFKKGGTVTAGNACKRSDAGAMMLVTSAQRARDLGLRPLGRLLASAQAGVHPKYMGMGPVPAVAKCLQRAGMNMAQIDLVELNEAFAAQAVPVMRESGMDWERTNVNGGAIALGHPTGATGAILLAKLLYELRQRGGRYGLVTMCIGGGMGMAALFECLDRG